MKKRSRHFGGILHFASGCALRCSMCVLGWEAIKAWQPNDGMKATQLAYSSRHTRNKCLGIYSTLSTTDLMLRLPCFDAALLTQEAQPTNNSTFLKICYTPAIWRAQHLCSRPCISCLLSTHSIFLILCQHLPKLPLRVLTSV